MRIEVVTPWRASDPWRTRNWLYVAKHLTGAGYRPQPFDAGGEQFSRAASRNLAVRSSSADVVILSDADLLAPPIAYRRMAHLAHQTGRMVVGFSEYRALDKQTTLRVLKGADPFTQRPVGTTVDWSTGGLIAMTPYAWRRAGGMDERFTGWGCEDFAFAHAAGLVLGPLVRLASPAVHLWHPIEQKHAGLEANSELMARYLEADTLEELAAIRRVANV